MSSKTKFTKGPWHPIEFSGFFNIQDKPYYEAKNILNRDDCEQAEANALLCAAAPTMYEALQEVKQYMGTVNADHPVYQTITNALNLADNGR